MKEKKNFDLELEFYNSDSVLVPGISSPKYSFNLVGKKKKKVFSNLRHVLKRGKLKVWKVEVLSQDGNVIWRCTNNVLLYSLCLFADTVVKFFFFFFWDIVVKLNLQKLRSNCRKFWRRRKIILNLSYFFFNLLLLFLNLKNSRGESFLIPRKKWNRKWQRFNWRRKRSEFMNIIQDEC